MNCKNFVISKCFSQGSGDQRISGSFIQSRGDARLHGVNVDEQFTNVRYIWRQVNGTKLVVCIVTSDGDKDLQIDTNQVADQFVYHDFQDCASTASNLCDNRGKIASSTGIKILYFVHVTIIHHSFASGKMLFRFYGGTSFKRSVQRRETSHFLRRLRLQKLHDQPTR